MIFWLKRRFWEWRLYRALERNSARLWEEWKQLDHGGDA